MTIFLPLVLRKYIKLAKFFLVYTLRCFGTNDKFLKYVMLKFWTYHTVLLSLVKPMCKRGIRVQAQAICLIGYTAKRLMA